jgi:hypothetical protein
MLCRDLAVNAHILPSHTESLLRWARPLLSRRKVVLPCLLLPGFEVLSDRSEHGS